MSDRWRCPKPQRRLFELGRRTRVWSVSPDGNVAIASRGWGLGGLHRVTLESGQRSAIGFSSWRTFRKQFRVGFPGEEPLVIHCKRPFKTRICRCGHHWATIDADELVSIFSGRGVFGCGSEETVAMGGRQEALRGRAQMSIALDCEGRRLAVGAHGVVAVYALDTNFRIARRIGRIRLPGQSPRLLVLGPDWLWLLAENTEAFSIESKWRLGAYRLVGDQAVQTVPVFELMFGERPQIRSRPEILDEGSAFERRPWAERSIEVPAQGVQVAASADQQHIACGLVDHRVMLISLATGEIVFDGGHREPINFIGFPGDRLASADRLGRLIIRDSDDSRGFVVA